MKKYLVTGGAGFIGSHLVDKLIKQEHKVTIIDDLSAGKEENINPKADFCKVDICDFDKIKSLFKGIDYVFHLAAIPRVPVSIKDPIGTSKNNILGALTVFKAATDANVKRIVFASSSSVYGDQKEFPLRENMIPSPLSPYALQKLVGEQFAKLFIQLYKIQIISLRYFNVYGPRIDFNSDYSLVLGKFLRQKRENKALTIFGDGEQSRGFCYVDDIVEANIKTIESNKLNGGEIINISSGESYTVNYLSNLIGGNVQHLPPRLGDVLHTRADITLAKKLLDWEPKIDFKEGIKRTIEWFDRYNEF